MNDTGKTIIDDLMNITCQAAEFGENAKNEAESYMRGKLSSLLSEMNLATREELDAWQERFSMLEGENNELKARIEKLEEQLLGKSDKKR